MFEARLNRRQTSDGVASRKHRPDYQIVLFVSMLLLLGLIILFSISPATVEKINAASGGDLDQAHFVEKQVLYLFVGVVAFAVSAALPIKFWTRSAQKLLLLGLLASALLFILGLAGSGLVINTGGAVRWFNLGFVSFQPAELLKFGFMLFTAVFLGKRIGQQKVNDINETLIPLGVLMALAMFFIIVLQKDMGTGITLTGIVVTMLFVAGLNLRNALLSFGALMTAGLFLIVTSPHRIERVMTFFNPSKVSDAESYHIEQAAIALGSGGFSGRGLGQSIQAFGYLPEALNDSILGIIGESFGFVGVVVVMCLFFALLLRLLNIMDHVLDPVQRMITAGVFGWVATHAVVNIGAMSGVIPLTGVTLPFLSFGGTSLLFMMMALGIVFHISKFTSHQKVEDIANAGGSYDENSRGRRGVGRSRYAGTSGYQRAR